MTRSGIDAPAWVGGIRVTARRDDQPQQQQNVTNGCAEWLNVFCVPLDLARSRAQARTHRRGCLSASPLLGILAATAGFPGWQGPARAGGRYPAWPWCASGGWG